MRGMSTKSFDPVRVSKFMAFALRHDPAAAGLTLDHEGWAPVEDLLRGLKGHGYDLTREDLEGIVAKDSKGRYAIEGDLIRANQGHSTKDVEVTFEVALPPNRLYHGTTMTALEAIKREGLSKMARHHVHLSPDIQTAKIVGSRRKDALVILSIDAALMLTDGHTFYRSQNGVWLVDAVPAMYLSVLPGA